MTTSRLLAPIASAAKSGLRCPAGDPACGGESPHGRAISRGETVIDTIEENDPYGREEFT